MGNKQANDDRDRVLRALHDLAATCSDAAEGYAKAAKGVHDQDLSNRLLQISTEREQFEEALRQAIKNTGGQPRTDLHAGGILHRGWVDLEQRLRSKDDAEIVIECIAGDTGTLKHYDHALAEDPKGEVRELLERQRASVQRDLSALQAFANRAHGQHA